MVMGKRKSEQRRRRRARARAGWPPVDIGRDHFEVVGGDGEVVGVWWSCDDPDCDLGGIHHSDPRQAGESPQNVNDPDLRSGPFEDRPCCTQEGPDGHNSTH